MQKLYIIIQKIALQAESGKYFQICFFFPDLVGKNCGVQSMHMLPCETEAPWSSFSVPLVSHGEERARNLCLAGYAHAGYPGFSFLPPGFSPYRGREERRVQRLDYMFVN